jgi:hypothetical protein
MRRFLCDFKSHLVKLRAGAGSDKCWRKYYLKFLLNTIIEKYFVSIYIIVLDIFSNFKLVEFIIAVIFPAIYILK